ncbi:MAG: alkaline phosphatase D family protein [Xanthobacteraceae bacterium]|nr:alkaline phosphatase D family protein [Xanthobacteraceae bacterium]
MTSIRSAVKSPTRRRLLKGAAGAGLVVVAAPALLRYAAAQSWRVGDPFSLGVASGAPRPDGFVLWTRLAPEPQSINPLTPGGMSGGDATVGYEIANDPGMHDVVRHGEAIAEQAFAYSVHLDVRGLPPGRPYWYRFTSGDAASRVGRAATLPAPGTALERLRFGFVSCSNYEHGYFSAYRHLADENPEFVIFLGDYIYEYIEERRPVVRRHSDGIEAATLPTYRNRYAQYRLDPDLQRLHAEAPALVTWDDHEVQNDYADKWSEYFDDPEQFLVRRAAAYRAFYEHMPVRPILSRPEGPAMRIYDRFTFGDLIEISLIDGRQYRSREACYGPPDKGGTHLETDASCPERRDAGRTMLGFAQEAWLNTGLAHSQAQWNLIAQDVLMAQLRIRQDNADAFSTDDWDGYPANRTRLLKRIQNTRVSNPVVIGGDAHSFFANDLRPDFLDPASPVVATEFVGTSISAYGPPYDVTARALPDNPHIHFFESRRRGYVAIDLERSHMQVRMRMVSDAADAKADIATLRTFAVEGGRPGVVAA